jgi:hypothetical protein
MGADSRQDPQGRQDAQECAGRRAVAQPFALPAALGEERLARYSVEMARAYVDLLFALHRYGH